ncbi:hypothetical protein C9374_008051 [Naegleria lovaniensis]|uniref:Methyltransferase domain-containing protein n=1 Tax=Naegleria lovaniensis TaxID=51637 RepID=A0AA88GHX9_NAELO|nr:uncharacterized protein C9374_008051 [Naegleria lovaniensis]KAG2378903.1 hypothetical protein C9374_008051 [Naegleria lovaniensis]
MHVLSNATSQFCPPRTRLKDYSAPPQPTTTCAEMERPVDEEMQQRALPLKDISQVVDGQHEIHDSTRKQHKNMLLPARSTSSTTPISTQNKTRSTACTEKTTVTPEQCQFSLFEDKDHTIRYSEYRPTFPKNMYEEHVFTRKLLSMHTCGEHVENSQSSLMSPKQLLLNSVKSWIAIDVGCGSGQATFDLAPYCKHVIGVDTSLNQISLARQQLRDNYQTMTNVDFEIGVAENLEALARKYISGNYEPTNNSDKELVSCSIKKETSDTLETFDLIVSSASLHWFDFEKFFKSVDKVLKKGGLLVSWCYGLHTFENEQAQKTLLEFYHSDLLKDCWTSRRYHIDTEYKHIPHIPYPQNKEYITYTITSKVTLDQYIGFISTWSSLHLFMEQHGKEKYQDLLGDFRTKMREALGLTSHCESTTYFVIHLPVWIVKTWKPYS